MLLSMKLSKLTMLASAGVLLAAASVATVFCCYRALLPIEIDPNEAWNAWQSKSLAHLYPNSDALIVNNYPPLYFYFLHCFSLLGYEEIYAGRAISILASFALTFLVYRTILIFGMPRIAAGIGAIWFLATLAGSYTGYVGMNDPHLTGLAVMCAGFTWFVARTQRGQAVEPAVLLMVLAGFIKHSLIAIPVAAFIWLAFESPLRATRAAVCGAVACAAGLVICHMAYGTNFMEQLLMPRDVSLDNAHLALASLKPLLAGSAIVTIWLVYDRRRRLTQKMAILLSLTLASGFVQGLGAGVDVNAYFEYLFALAAGIGIAAGRSQALYWATLGSDRIGMALPVVLLLGLSLSSKDEPYRLIFSKDFRGELAENVEAVQTEAARVKKIPGPVSCTVMLVCYWAKKSFVWDDFALKQRVSTGKWTQQELDRKARLQRVRFETIDDRTVW
jgi:hypothetical protein